MKLYNYGIRGTMFDLLKNCLNNRSQITSIGECFSNVATVKCGVPEGSVLGLVLFLIYMNDIKYACPTIKLFADDTNMFVTANSVQELNVQCNVYLQDLNEWFLGNRLGLNVSKTCFTPFHPHPQYYKSHNLDLLINNFKIQHVNCCKYLGVYIDKQMK